MSRTEISLSGRREPPSDCQEITGQSCRDARFGKS
jgi:hypothetical protein